MNESSLIAACLLLAVGTYLSRASGLPLGSRTIGTAAEAPTRSHFADHYLDLAVANLLAAVVVTSIVARGGVDLAQFAGVAVGGIATWRGCQLPLIVLAAAVTTALLRA